MLRSNLFLTVCLVMATMPQDGVKSMLPTPTQSGQKSSQADSRNTAEEARIKAEVAAIMAIREQLGGGVAETLGDLSLEMPGAKRQDKVGDLDTMKPMSLEESFAKKLAQQSQNHITREITLGGDWTLINEKAEENAGPNPEHREAIREAARMLEEAAAILEDAEQYGQADSVRATAGELWRSARKTNGLAR